MPARLSLGRVGGTVGLAALWAWPSAFFLPVFLGLENDSTPRRIVSVILCFVAGLVVVEIARWLTRADRRAIWVVMGIALAAVAVVLPLYFLAVSNGLLGGLGGDRGQVLEMAWTRITAGIHPYSYVNENGGTISSFPGSVFLAAPAVLLTGNAGYMTLYLLPITLFILYRVHPVAAGITAVSVVMAPAFWMDALSRGDLVTTSLFAFATGAATLKAALQPSPTLSTWLWPIAFGVALSTRVPNVSVLLFAVMIIVGSGRLRVAVLQTAIAAASYVVVTAPLYLWNPQKFSPMTAQMDHSGGRWGVIGVLLSLAVLCVIALRYRPWREWPVPAGLALAVSLFAFALTLIPMLTAYSFGGVFRNGYAVLALTAPIVVLALAGRSSEREPAEDSA